MSAALARIPRTVASCGALLAAMALGGAVSATQAAGQAPRCSGAAAMDREHPCSNPKLRLRVAPTPEDALLTPDAPCREVETEPAVPGFCTFGASEPAATRSVALLGDSHAAHWRGAADELVRAKGWRGVSLTKSGCPYTPLLLTASQSVQDGCGPWYRSIAPWLAAHPDISTVLVAAHAGTSFPVTGGTTLQEEKINAAISAFDGLPSSVTRIVVIRDPPITRVSTLDCVERAIRRRREAGRVCAVPRRKVLRQDALVEAARRMASPRVQSIDLLSFFCTRTRCPPVIGGVLVHKDQHHITQAFSRSLGPYLLRGLRRIEASP